MSDKDDALLGEECIDEDNDGMSVGTARGQVRM